MAYGSHNLLPRFYFTNTVIIARSTFRIRSLGRYVHSETFVGKESRAKIRTAFKSGAYDKFDKFYFRDGRESSGDATRYIDNRQGDNASKSSLF